ncbi:hypothetical protein, partial [Campylobacter rectus]|uniref:hypothetical protein n=1 Tax=Campylobacter rectus TaxID=203 RepID=UPI0023F144ED
KSFWPILKNSGCEIYENAVLVGKFGSKFGRVFVLRSNLAFKFCKFKSGQIYAAILSYQIRKRFNAVKFAFKF